MRRVVIDDTRVSGHCSCSFHLRLKLTTNPYDGSNYPRRDGDINEINITDTHPPRAGMKEAATQVCRFAGLQTNKCCRQIVDKHNIFVNKL